MAAFAAVAGIDVGGVLAGGGRTVMAADTTARHIGMIECRSRPAGGAVTILAVIAAGHMARRFSIRDLVVMTGNTASDDRSMVDPEHL